MTDLPEEAVEGLAAHLHDQFGRGVLVGAPSWSDLRPGKQKAWRTRAKAALEAAAPAIEEKARKQERERVLNEAAGKFEKRAQIEAEKRAKVKKAEATDRASGKLAEGHSYEATWNYKEGLSCAYQRAASDLRTLAALEDSDGDM